MNSIIFVDTILIFILLKEFRATTISLSNSTNTTYTNSTNQTISSPLINLTSIVNAKRLEQRNFFKDSINKKIKEPSLDNSVIIENEEFSLEFNLQIDKILSLTASNAYVELTARLKLKWWNRKSSSTVDSTLSYQPVIFFKNPYYSLTNNHQRSLSNPTIFDFHYAALEKNLTFKFKCNNNQDFLDTSQFPFDIHSCNLDIFIDLEPVGQRKQTMTSNYSPNIFRPRLSIINRVNVENNVKTASNDWVFKKLAVSAWNSTPETNMLRIQLKFAINRQYESYIYILILPLGIFTCLVFVVFWLPTTDSGEKTFLTLINFVCLLVFNYLLFNLTMSTMGFAHIPQLLQYSSCLIFVNCIVFVYICLAKSVYHYGLFNLNTKYVSSAKSAKNTYVRSQNDYERIDEDEQQLQKQVEFVRLGNQLEKRTALNGIDKIEFNRQQTGHKRCRCNSMETDADCLNITLDSSNNISNSNKFHNFTTTSKSKNFRTLRPAKNDPKNKKPHIEIRQQKIIITNLDSNNKDSVQCLNGNWILTESNKKQMNPGNSYACCVKSGTISSLPDYDSRSHLTRVVKKNENESLCYSNNYNLAHKQEKAGESQKTGEILSLNKPVEAHNKINDQDLSDLGSKWERYLQIQSGFMSRGLISVGKLNTSVDRLVDLEERNLRENFLRNRWRRNSRWLDGICFVFVFGTLFVCSVLIFFIFPIMKINLFFRY